MIYSKSRAIVEWLVVTGLSSTIVFLLIWMSYSGVLDDQSSRESNRLIGSTPFFKLVYEDVVASHDDEIPIMILLTLFAFIPILILAIYYFLRAILSTSKNVQERSGSAIVMLLPVIFCAIIVEYSLGLPFAIALFGMESHFDFVPMLIYGMLITISVSTSFVLSAHAQNS